jgi:hypothetical protein
VSRTHLIVAYDVLQIAVHAAGTEGEIKKERRRRRTNFGSLLLLSKGGACAHTGTLG